MLTSKPNLQTILDTMIELTDRHLVQRGVYCHGVPEKGICNGLRACAIGSLFIAAGVERDNRGDDYWGFDGIAEDDTRRDMLTRTSPDARRAYLLLNRAAAPLLTELGYEPNDPLPFGDALETVFEGSEEHELQWDKDNPGQWRSNPWTPSNLIRSLVTTATELATT